MINTAASASFSVSSPIFWIIGVVIFVFMVVDVARSQATVGAKVGWIIFSFFCTILALIVWLIWGRRKAYRGAM
ncbi:hypothetical protein M6D93_05190 [Jatrophihabitans telluris]|uniref:Cardiolipin synthase N-terminal domain-containing protein n=1 Tax=Jatrophihabitans telluris TaxID=2038343 RepID=A0ABY4R2M8_9ACTN|nr:hypothetical protein [Jatrophihabitans telluris]UQX89400.1 hypothetical protein M6D93_05190 [Jatrophihabitans telluris]